jgi:hypothetical protein
VNYWGSHPDAGNDDCWTGHDFATLAEAEAKFSEPPTFTDGKPVLGTAYIELDGPGVHKVRKNPDFDARAAAREAARDEAEWRRERAMQAGMAFGVDGYNDEMGY